jgi:hypothetical protein
MSKHRMEFGLVDLSLLKQQKATLVELANQNAKAGNTNKAEALDGTINMMDAIQDYIEGRVW